MIPTTSPTLPQATPRRRRGSNPRLMLRTGHLLALTLAFTAACTANSEDVRPDPEDLYFPTGLVVSPDQRYLLVANGNSELRYDSGTLDVIDLEIVDQIADAWTARDANYAPPGGCAIDPDDRETLVCDDGGDPAPRFILGDAGVRIGNFTSALGVQELSPTEFRVIATVRGDPSVTYADWDGTKLNCAAEQGFPLCDDDHRLTTLRNLEDFTLADEPYQVFVDSVNEFAAISHLTSGTVTLMDSPRDGAAILTDSMINLFNANSVGATGASAVAGRDPSGAGEDLIYLASRTEDRVHIMTVSDGPFGKMFVPSSFFFLNGVGSNTGGSSDTRGAVFDEGGDRMYLVNRLPASLQVYDTSLDTTGFPQNRFLTATDICTNASTMATADVGDGTRVFVTCYFSGDVYVVDPFPSPHVEAIITAGRGPYGVTASVVRQKLYITNFLEDTIAVAELDPTSPLRYEVILRIGVRR